MFKNYKSTPSSVLILLLLISISIIPCFAFSASNAGNISLKSLGYNFQNSIKNNTVSIKGTISADAASKNRFVLNSGDTKYNLISSVSFIKKFTNKYVEINGIVKKANLVSNQQFLIVKSCKETQKPVIDIIKKDVSQTNDLINGYLSVSKPDIILNPELIGTYIFKLKTDSGIFLLSGSTKGMEEYDQKKLEVSGHYILTLVATEFLGFNVESFKILDEVTPTPEVKVSKVHSIVSDKPLYYSFPNADSGKTILGGNFSASWMENSQSAFFNGRIALDDINTTMYDITLVKVISCTKDTIAGLFDIRKDGVIVETNVQGKAYGLDLGVGEYFKFYSDDTRWHMSAYITSRFDY